MSDSKATKDALFWEASDFGPHWEGIVVYSDPDKEEWVKYRIDTDDSAKFRVWRGKKSEPGVYTEVRTGPLSQPFECLCQAQRACEAHHA